MVHYEEGDVVRVVLQQILENKTARATLNRQTIIVPRAEKLVGKQCYVRLVRDNLPAQQGLEYHYVGLFTARNLEHVPRSNYVQLALWRPGYGQKDVLPTSEEIRSCFSLMNEQPIYYFMRDSMKNVGRFCFPLTGSRVDFGGSIRDIVHHDNPRAPPAIFCESPRQLRNLGHEINAQGVDVLPLEPFVDSKLFNHSSALFGRLETVLVQEPCSPSENYALCDSRRILVANANRYAGKHVLARISLRRDISRIKSNFVTSHVLPQRSLAPHEFVMLAEWTREMRTGQPITFREIGNHYRPGKCDTIPYIAVGSSYDKGRFLLKKRKCIPYEFGLHSVFNCLPNPSKYARMILVESPHTLQALENNARELGLIPVVLEPLSGL